MAQFIQGEKGGKGGGGARTPVESPNSLRSASFARIIDVVSEGEIEGLFLSRLCGGEHTGNRSAASNTFLSRLCGGERALDSDVWHGHFLSRLCGGERRPISYASEDRFLSRLCGGERYGC